MTRPVSESPEPKRTKRVTLRDIAEAAGVKKMTVSDSLRGTGSVAPATREKVQRIARELNYIPNFAAKALATGRTGIIAILSGPVNEPYYATMIHLLEKHITANGYHLMLIRTSTEVEDLVNARGNIAVDGTIAVDMPLLVDEFQAHPTVPCVCIGTLERAELDRVLVDLSAAVEEALEIMLKSGCKRIAYLVTNTDLTLDTEVRARTYRAFMQRAGRPPEFINANTNELTEVQDKFEAYLDKNGCPDGLLCQNDETAMCAFSTLREAGYKVPKDMLLVGCDGQLHTKYFDPPLSTIAQPMQEMATHAWEFLKRRMEQPDLPRQEITLPGKLEIRRSLVSSARKAKG